MWTKSPDDINKIFKHQKTNFRLEDLCLYHNQKLIADGFIFVKSISLDSYEISKTAIFHVVYIQKDLISKDIPHLQIKWHANNDEDEDDEINFEDMISETDPAQKLGAYSFVKIYNQENFNQAVKIILQEVLKLRYDELHQHIGWAIRHDHKGKKDYSFWGNINKFKLTNQGESIGSYSILPNKDTIPFSYSDLEKLFDQLDPAVCYPLFLSIIYSIIDPEILRTKVPLYINICGKYKRDRKKSTYLSPQFIANLLCNFNFNTTKNKQMHGILHSDHNISINDNITAIQDKVHLNQHFPVLVFGSKCEISGSSKAYLRIKKEMQKIHRKKHEKFTPFFVTEKPISNDEILCLQIKDIKASSSIDSKNTICRLHSFYNKLILDLCNYGQRFYFPGNNFTQERQYALSTKKNRYEFRLSDPDYFDENRKSELDAFSFALAMLEELEWYNDNVGKNEQLSKEFTSFSNKAITWTQPLLQLPWINETPKQDSAHSFLLYVTDAIKNNFNDLPYFTEANKDYVFLSYPDCIDHFCKVKGFDDCRNEICRFLKGHGHLKINKNGFFISKQVAKIKHNVLAIKRSALDKYDD